jgi:hypothetical protein
MGNTTRTTNMFQLDTGSNGAAGPFLAWSARGTQDGAVGARRFFVRDGATKTEYDASKGFVLDIETMKTGWQMSEGLAGVAPTWNWNPSVQQMMPNPGDGWKKGFSIRCATGGGETATWEQSGAAVWDCLTDLAPKLAEQPGRDKLPLVRLIDARAVQFKRGSTVVPVLEIVKWVDRPDCLKDGAAAGIAINPPAPAPKAAPVPPPAPADADDLEF